jgi:hypothetical protein
MIQIIAPREIPLDQIPCEPGYRKGPNPDIERVVAVMQMKPGMHATVPEMARKGWNPELQRELYVFQRSALGRWLNRAKLPKTKRKKQYAVSTIMKYLDEPVYRDGARIINEAYNLKKRDDAAQKYDHTYWYDPLADEVLSIPPENFEEMIARSNAEHNERMEELRRKERRKSRAWAPKQGRRREGREDSLDELVSPIADANNMELRSELSGEEDKTQVNEPKVLEKECEELHARSKGVQSERMGELKTNLAADTKKTESSTGTFIHSSRLMSRLRERTKRVLLKPLLVISAAASVSMFLVFFPKPTTSNSPPLTPERILEIASEHYYFHSLPSLEKIAFDNLHFERSNEYQSLEFWVSNNRSPVFYKAAWMDFHEH